MNRIVNAAGVGALVFAVWELGSIALEAVWRAKKKRAPKFVVEERYCDNPRCLLSVSHTGKCEEAAPRNGAAASPADPNATPG